MSWIFAIIKERWFLMTLLLVNILGTIYGYYWYKYQLIETPWYFLPFVPDSPTASLFFVFVLIGFLLKKQNGLIEALAAASLFKYGIWAVGMNLGGAVVGPPLNFINFMLIFSHLGMAVQGLLYAPFYKIKGWHVGAAALWLFHNEIIDYIFDMMPRYTILSPYQDMIGYFTFWLSALSVFLVWRMRKF
ncbi:DUF1405 domain-containing protein [Fictibacillus phosphorivorans]|uniref:DUF1405 domain-containing protein n=1 Tax=Fictibacillus phosphorivorans TaxID=1221500 RepID=UPI00203FE1B8|nr:DUF1405 domain-containing protein [Fictibacillus phosphorivorans]MCM3718916.1 DUF1405 domain-containing protein [Fictibacillus phosphorivorans]MCM3776538.1 DUF1405 domain-containing protein [Fictibacillus phosphorivorans]